MLGAGWARGGRKSARCRSKCCVAVRMEQFAVHFELLTFGRIVDNGASCKLNFVTATESKESLVQTDFVYGLTFLLRNDTTVMEPKQTGVCFMQQSKIPLRVVTASCLPRPRASSATTPQRFGC